MFGVGPIQMLIKSCPEKLVCLIRTQAQAHANGFGFGFGDFKNSDLRDAEKLGCLSGVDAPKSQADIKPIGCLSNTATGQCPLQWSVWLAIVAVFIPKIPQTTQLNLR